MVNNRCCALNQVNLSLFKISSVSKKATGKTSIHICLKLSRIVVLLKMPID